MRVLPRYFLRRFHYECSLESRQFFKNEIDLASIYKMSFDLASIYKNRIKKVPYLVYSKMFSKFRLKSLENPLHFQNITTLNDSKIWMVGLPKGLREA